MAFFNKILFILWLSIISFNSYTSESIYFEIYGKWALEVFEDTESNSKIIVSYTFEASNDKLENSFDFVCNNGEFDFIIYLNNIDVSNLVESKYNSWVNAEVKTIPILLTSEDEHLMIEFIYSESYPGLTLSNQDDMWSILKFIINNSNYFLLSSLDEEDTINLYYSTKGADKSIGYAYSICTINSYDTFVTFYNDWGQINAKYQDYKLFTAFSRSSFNNNISSNIAYICESDKGGISIYFNNIDPNEIEGNKLFSNKKEQSYTGKISFDEEVFPNLISFYHLANISTPVPFITVSKRSDQLELVNKMRNSKTMELEIVLNDFNKVNFIYSLEGFNQALTNIDNNCKT